MWKFNPSLTSRSSVCGDLHLYAESQPWPVNTIEGTRDNPGKDVVKNLHLPPPGIEPRRGHDRSKRSPPYRITQQEIGLTENLIRFRLGEPDSIYTLNERRKKHETAKRQRGTTRRDSLERQSLYWRTRHISWFKSVARWSVG